MELITAVGPDQIDGSAPGPPSQGRHLALVGSCEHDPRPVRLEDMGERTERHLVVQRPVSARPISRVCRQLETAHFNASCMHCAHCQRFRVCVSIRQRLGVQIRTGVIGIHWFSDPRRERQRVECLAVASEKELTARFEEALRQAYAPIFQVAEPTDGYIQVRDAFRTNTPHSQQKRMVTLFLNLCEAAGMITEIPKASSPGPAPVRTKPKSGAAASSALKSRAETMLPPASRPDHAPLRPNLRAVDPQCHHRRESLMAAEPAPVPPLSAYLAKQCPRRVQLDLVEPGVSLEPTADIQMPLDEGSPLRHPS